MSSSLVIPVISLARFFPLLVCMYFCRHNEHNRSFTNLFPCVTMTRQHVPREKVTRLYHPVHHFPLVGFLALLVVRTRAPPAAAVTSIFCLCREVGGPVASHAQENMVPVVPDGLRPYSWGRSTVKTSTRKHSNDTVCLPPATIQYSIIPLIVCRSQIPSSFRERKKEAKTTALDV